MKLKPGMTLLAGSSSVGGARYEKEELEHTVTGDIDVKRWTTVRTIPNVDDHAAAVKARADALNRISKACVRTPFGRISALPAGELEAAIDEAMAIVDEHNQSTTCPIHFPRPLVLPVTSDEAATVSAIRAELARMMDMLEQATLARDPKRIAKVTARAREMSSVLADDSEASGEVAEAIAAARKLARRIRREVKKGAAAAEVELDADALAPVARCLWSRWTWNRTCRRCQLHSRAPSSLSSPSL